MPNAIKNPIAFGLLSFFAVQDLKEKKGVACILIKVSNPSYIKSQRTKRLGETWTYIFFACRL
jgi:hypothetical protein